MKSSILMLIVMMAAVMADGESPALKEFAVGNVNFAANIYKELAKSNAGNFLVCPISVDVVLGLVGFGAKEKTAQELIATLSLPASEEKIKQIFGDLAPHLQNTGSYNLTSANKVYVKEGFDIAPDFRTIATEVFRSEVENINFKEKAKAAFTINQWVEGKTNSLIKDLIQPSDLDDNTRLVLLNAIYFKGKWEKTFSVRDTIKRDFYLNAKDKTQVDMMFILDTFNYYESTELKAKFLELPYEGGDIVMTIVLPNERDGLPLLEKRLNEVLTTPKYENVNVNVQLPKFKVESTIQFKPILQQLGLIEAFEDTANFTGIGAHREALKISKVIQKAFINVEEEGTEAAAATAAFASVPASGVFFLVPPSKFHADHPFIYHLFNKKTGMPIFFGRFIG